MVLAPAKAQNTLLDKTLNTAKQLRNQKQFTEATAILGDFEKKYPGNLWIEQLYAQTLFWIKDYKQAETIYLRALHYHPENADLKYEYALLLYEMQKFDKARQLLTSYTRLVKNNAAAEALLGKLLYWDYDFKQALVHLKQAKKLSPQNNEIEKLYREVYRLLSPQLDVHSSYKNDTQPLKSFGGGIGYRWYISPAIDLQFSGNTRQYASGGVINTFSDFLAGNRFHLNRTGTQITLLGGAVYGNADLSVQWQGRLSVRQKLGKHLQTNFSAAHSLYDYTLGSLNYPLMINQYDLNLGYDKPGAWSGQLGIRSQFFPDDNYVKAFFLWFLSKPMHFSEFDLRLGYAFNYMDAKEDRFIMSSNPADILALNNPNIQIDGVYFPYYTPQNQYSNSLIAHLSYPVSNKGQFSVHASIGLYSKTLAPGFYLDNSTQNQPQILQAYGTVGYTPVDLGADFHADLSDKLTLTFSYSYLKTFYYNLNQLQLRFNYYF
jgi:tetratricopeptide (TPR) repeat protein